MKAHIHPSILAADFMNFERDFKTIGNADAIHVDVMDGHFVPNLTFGVPMVRRMREVSELPLDVHLMITDVDDHVLEYADLGVESVTFHQEASLDPIKAARLIRSAGSLASIAVKPSTSVEFILDNLPEFDMVLIMTVEPGFGGQKFMQEVLPKLVAASESIKSSGLPIRLQVDGGIDLSNIHEAALNGADTFVAGSSVFGVEQRQERIEALRVLAQV